MSKIRKRNKKTCLCLSKSVRQIILCSAWFCTAKDINQPQFQGWNLRLWKQPRRVNPDGTLKLYICDVHVAGKGGTFYIFFYNKGPIGRGYHCFESFGCTSALLPASKEDLPFDPTIEGLGIQHIAFMLHPLFETVLWNNCIQLQSWIWTLKSLIADSWHSVPWPYPPHLEDWSSCKSLQAKGTVKVEGIVVIVVKAQWSLPSPWHCSSRAWSFATAVCCWAVGVPVRSLGALRGF